MSLITAQWYSHKVACAIACSPFIFTQVNASELSIANPITRSLTLQDNEISLRIGAVYGETNDDKKSSPLLNLGYGLTQHLTIGPAGARYSIVPRNYNGLGLEVVVEGGIMGLYESSDFGDSIGAGIGVTGKYVLSENFAVTLGSHYVFWNEDKRDNREELRVDVGAMWGVHPAITLFANTEYRELKDFTQDKAWECSVGALYVVNDQTDFVFTLSSSEFDPALEGYDNDVSFESAVSVSLTYRF